MRLGGSLIKGWSLWLVLLIGVSGCQTPVDVVAKQQIDQGSLVVKRDAQLSQLMQFQFSGGLGVWTDSESIPARITWKQSDNDLELTLSGPLGVGDMHLSDNAGYVTLLRGKTVVTSGTSVNQVIQQGLGLSAEVPLEELKQWVRGLAGSGRAINRDEGGRLVDLRYSDQSGALWSVRFKRYESVGDLDLPSLITASGGDYSVRLVLKNWELNTNTNASNDNELNKRLSIPGR